MLTFGRFFSAGLLLLSLVNVAQAAPAQATGPKAVTGSAIVNMMNEPIPTLPMPMLRSGPVINSFPAIYTDHSSCVDEACKKVGCSFESDTIEVAKACSGNYGGGCVRAACSKFSCSFKTDVLDIVVACRDNYGGECVRIACDKASCDFKSDVVDFAVACQQADADCVRAVCNRTGCTFKSDALEAIRACKGS